jgi:hypothetical protein
MSGGLEDGHSASPLVFFTNLPELYRIRHGRARPGHPRLRLLSVLKDVDARR